MCEHSYPIKFSSEDSPTLPTIDATFGRVTVLLGANGSGKSSAIRHLKRRVEDFGSPIRPVVYVEGGRVIQIPSGLGLGRGNFEKFRDAATAEHQHRSAYSSSLSTRVEAALFALERKGVDLAAMHSDACDAWDKNGRVGEMPNRDTPPLEKLFSEFGRVFPDISVAMEQETHKRILCTKSERRYSATHLSDGERQVLAILADIALQADPKSLILVDEPELNLHASLACRLWEEIEAALPEAVFVYATHCLSFAMRQSVGKVIILNRGDANALELDSVRDIDPHEARVFLGAIPAIVAAPAALAVEGTEDSFDSRFYRWILGREDVEVIGLEGCQSVRAAATHTGIWNRMAPAVRIAGIIDRDFRSDEELQKLSCESCHILDLHEAESYLCYPEIICAVAKALGLVETAPTPDDIQHAIIDFFRARVVVVAAKRMSARSEVSFSVSVPNKAINRITDEAEVRRLIRHQAEGAVRQAKQAIDPKNIDDVFCSELATCTGAIERRDIETILKLVPGRELLAHLAHEVGARGSVDIARAVSKQLSVDQFECLARLRVGVRSLIAPDGASNP